MTTNNKASYLQIGKTLKGLIKQNFRLRVGISLFSNSEVVSILRTPNDIDLVLENGTRIPYTQAQKHLEIYSRFTSSWRPLIFNFKSHPVNIIEIFKGDGYNVYKLLLPHENIKEGDYIELQNKQWKVIFIQRGQFITVLDLLDISTLEALKIEIEYPESGTFYGVYNFI